MSSITHQLNEADDLDDPHDEEADGAQQQRGSVKSAARLCHEVEYLPQER